MKNFENISYKTINKSFLSNDVNDESHSIDRRKVDDFLRSNNNEVLTSQVILFEKAKREMDEKKSKRQMRKKRRRDVLAKQFLVMLKSVFVPCAG